VKAAHGYSLFNGTASTLLDHDRPARFTCENECGEPRVAFRKKKPDQKKITKPPDDISVYRLSQSASGALVSCRTTVVIAGKTVDAIIDTGAARTILAFSWYQEMASDMPPLKPCTANLRGAGGEACNVKGVMELQFFLEGMPYLHPVIVSIMPCVEMLIGIDFLYRNGAIIDCQYGRLIIKHQNIVIRSYGLSTPFSVRVLESCVLAPETQLLLGCYTDHLYRNQDVMFEVCTMLGDGIVILPGLVKCDERGHLKLPVGNIGQYSHEVAADQTIGTISLRSVEEDELYSFVDSGSEEVVRSGSMVREGLALSRLFAQADLKDDKPAWTGGKGGRVVSTSCVIASCADCGATCSSVRKSSSQVCQPAGVETLPSPDDPVNLLQSEVSASDLLDGRSLPAVGEAKGHILAECPVHLKLTLSEADLSAVQLKEAVQLLNNYQDVFVGPDGKVGYTDLVRHRIDTGDVSPFKMPVRRMGPAQRDILDKEMDKILETETVVKSVSL